VIVRATIAGWTLLAVFLVPIGPSQADPAAAPTRWNGFTSLAFTQGFVRTSCPYEEPCQNDAFELNGDLNVHCPGFPGRPSLFGMCAADVAANALDEWMLYGFAGRYPTGGEVPSGTAVLAIAERVDADLFVVTGSASSVNAAPGRAQVAVFRYFGDPTVFDGLEVESIEDVVDLGIIAADDVLAEQTIVEIYGEIELQVQVTGLADDEIVVFATGEGFPIAVPVPATSAAGAAAVLLILLGLGTWTVLRRRSRVDRPPRGGGR
jgi:hypothetical protein